MNSVALPASAASPALSAESDLIRQAARGHSDAFEELFRRHSQMAWRLAQAVAMDRDSAVDAVREGFARALRAHRRIRGGDTGDGVFRPQLLAAIYRAAAERGHERVGMAPKGRSQAKDADTAFAEAAFRSLPERWRAAVWLSEVETMDTARVAAVLGVSSAVATQLIHRAQRGLAGRYAQARQTAPEHMGPVLRKFALAVPANLAATTEARWASAGGDRESIFAPWTNWLEEHAIRPMWVSVGGLIALGLIGIGVLGPANPVRSTLGANGTRTSAGAIPVHTCYGVPCTTPSGTLNPFSNLSNTLTAGAGTTAGAPATGTLAPSPAGTGSTGAPSTPGTPSLPTTPNPPSKPSTPPVTVPTLPITLPTVPPLPITLPTVPPNLVPPNPVVNVTQTGNATNINLLPTSTGSTATVTLNCSTPIGITIGTTQIGCTGASTSPSSTSTNPLSTTTQAVSSVVNSTLQTLTKPVGGLTSHL